MENKMQELLEKIKDCKKRYKSPKEIAFYNNLIEYIEAWQEDNVMQASLIEGIIRTKMRVGRTKLLFETVKLVVELCKK